MKKKVVIYEIKEQDIYEGFDKGTYRIECRGECLGYRSWP